MDTPLILADQILALIRKAGVTKMEAHAALSIASEVLPTLSDISFAGVSDHPQTPSD